MKQAQIVFIKVNYNDDNVNCNNAKVKRALFEGLSVHRGSLRKQITLTKSRKFLL